MLKRCDHNELIQLWKEELSVRGKSMDSLIEKLKTILGEYYYELYDYFLGVMEADYNYKFMIARRCLVLYQIFLMIFETTGEKPELKGKVLSDGAIPKLDSALAGKRSLLVDDILIHGRRVCELQERLRVVYGCKNVDIRVYMALDGKKCMQDEILDKVQLTELAQEWEWRTLSDAIVRAIYVSNIPYTSFVPALTMDKKPAVFSKEWEWRSNESESQRDEGCKVFIGFQKRESERPNLFEVLSYKECLRSYINSTVNTVLLVPYVFTKAIKREKIDNFFEAFSTHITAFSVICAELRTRKKWQEDWNAYRLSLFNAVLSQMAGLHFLREEYRGNRDCDTLSRIYGEDITLEFQRMTYDTVQEVLTDSYEDLRKYLCDGFQEEPELEKVYNSLINTGFDEEKFWEYLSKNRRIDERRAQEDKERLLGISLDFIFKRCSNEENRKKAVLGLLKSMDTGCAAVSYKLLGYGKAYASRILTGEQSYRIIVEKYAEIVRNMIFLEERNEDVWAYITWACENHIIEDEQAEELKEFYGDNKGDLDNWNIVPIIENRKFWKISDVRKNYLEFTNNKAAEEKGHGKVD